MCPLKMFLVNGLEGRVGNGTAKSIVLANIKNHMEPTFKNSIPVVGQVNLGRAGNTFVLLDDLVCVRKRWSLSVHSELLFTKHWCLHSLGKMIESCGGVGGTESCATVCWGVKLSNHLSDGAFRGNHTRVYFLGTHRATLFHKLPCPF